MQHVIQFLHTQTYTHLTFTHAIRHKTPQFSSDTQLHIHTHTPSGSCTTPLVNEALYRQVHNTHTHTTWDARHETSDIEIPPHI